MKAGNNQDIIKVIKKPKVVVDIDGKEYITLMSYAFCIGKQTRKLGRKRMNKMRGTQDKLNIE